MEFVGQMRILTVDDDEGSRKLIKAMLTPLGCQVFTASSGAEAVDMVGSGKWDAILMDIAMPEMDGITALGIIREKYPMEDLPVVMVTGSDDMEARYRALELRANDFIVKPVEQGELMARLGNILTMHWAKRELEERLKEAEEAQDEMMKMMGSVVHDIKGALTCAKGFLELAITEDEASGISLPGGFVHKALTAVDRAGGIAEEANNVSAMSRGKLKPKIMDVDLKAVLGKRLGDFRGVASNNNMNMKLECSVDSPVARVDRALLEKLFGNLVSGAVRRAGAKGSVTGSITPSGDEYLMVEVKDNGAGSTHPFRQRLFDRECQEEFRESGLDSQTGIGMSFSRMAVEAMGGKMWVTSEPGAGTSFSFMLPAGQTALAGASGRKD